VGERIKETQEWKAWGQAELARVLGITPTSLWAIKAGRHAPRPKTLRTITQERGVPIEELNVDRDEQAR
jgi:transcriptional regulator with XRE-family HTH domain